MPYSATVPGIRTWLSLRAIVLPLTSGSGLPWAAPEAASGGSPGFHSHLTCVMLGTRISGFSQLAAVVYKCVYFPGAFQRVASRAEAGSQ